jgi:tubulin polyglutamylase TTLL5
MPINNKRNEKLEQLSISLTIENYKKLNFQINNFRAKKDKSNQQQSNYWVTNGSLGSKEAVLVFRTSVLTASLNASTSQNGFDYPDSPSSSSTCADLSIKAQSNEKLYSCSLPKRIDTETFNLNEKKSKKRHLELSLESSSSSSASLSSDNMEKSDNLESENDKLSDNKENVIEQLERSEMPASIFNITYKFINTETRLLRKILNAHGLMEVSHEDQSFNLLWTGNQLKPDMLRNLSPYQRINHFPR